MKKPPYKIKTCTAVDHTTMKQDFYDGDFS